MPANTQKSLIHILFIKMNYKLKTGKQNKEMTWKHSSMTLNLVSLISFVLWGL